MNTSTAQKENIMGTMPVGKLLMTISLPIMISMLIQSLYNVVDSYFVSKISENALSAVSLAFPMQSLIIAVATGTCVGVNALLSRKLGQHDQKAVNDAAENGIFLAILSSLVFILFGIFFARGFMAVQTDVAEIVDGGTIYLKICTICCPGIFMSITFARLLQSTGRTIYSMIGQIAGALTNIALDPLLIFGIGFFPEMGIAGAAVATVAGQVLGACFDIILNHYKNKDIQLSLRRFRPNGAVIKEIYIVGIPTILNNSLMAIMTYGLNKILLAFSTSATAVLGVFFKLNSFIVMPVIGLNNGLIPIVAYNFGARKRERIISSIRLAMIWAVSYMALGLLLFQLFPRPILSPFIEIPSTMEMGVHALRRISPGFLAGGLGFVLCASFQALHKAYYSLIVQGLRQLVIILPVAYFLALAGDVNMVWWAFPIADYLSLFICIALYIKITRDRISRI